MNKVLSELNIVLTRAEDQSAEDALMLKDLGANVISFPTIKVESVKDFENFDNVLGVFNSFDYLIFTSANAVIHFANHLEKSSKIISYEKLKVVAVGKKTATTCREFGIKIDLVPKIHTAEGILDLLKKEQVESKNVLIPCSVLAKDDLKLGLENIGATVYKIPIYTVTIPSDDDINTNKIKLEQSPPDLCVFTSPSTYGNFLKILGIDQPDVYFKNIKVAAIGTVTQKAIEQTGVKVDIIPKEFNMISLINSITDFYSKK